jgi:hypothetical protein
MMMFLCGCAMIFSVAAQSQLSLLFPFGVPVQPNSGSSFWMGGAADAVAGDYSVMLRNPANLGFIDKTVFSSLYTFDFTQDAQSNAHSNFMNGSPRQISIGVPIGKFGTIGLSSDNRSDALTKFRPPSQQFGYDTSAIVYRAGLATTGGLIGWQVGWGREWPMLQHIRAGLAYERIYFSYAETVQRTVTDASRTVDSRDSSYTKIGADALRAGVLLPLGKIKFGLSGEYFLPADVKKNNAIYSVSADTSGPVPIDGKNYSARIRMPPSFTIGVSYAITQDWLAAADFTSVEWNMYDAKGVLSNARSGPAPSVSAGVNYVPVNAILYPKYIETIRYGAGFRYTELPARESSEFALSLGVGLPIGRGRGEFDLGVEAGKRTCRTYSGYSENFVHIAIGVNGGHKWSKSSAGNY